MATTFHTYVCEHPNNEVIIGYELISDAQMLVIATACCREGTVSVTHFTSGAAYSTHLPHIMLAWDFARQCQMAAMIVTRPLWDPQTNSYYVVALPIASDQADQWAAVVGNRGSASSGLDFGEYDFTDLRDALSFKAAVESFGQPSFIIFPVTT